MDLSRQPRRSRHLHGPSLALASVAAITALLTGCSRTGLEIGDGFLPVGDAADDAPSEAEVDAPQDVAAPQDVVSPQDVAPAVVASSTPQDPCANKPPIPCPGGGFEYCVAGAYSACPQRCDLCVPGSQQVCFLTYCHSWGVQTCAADGESFGYCQEQSPPAACASIADQDQITVALEQCCIDNGFCCEDTFDLNGNGKTGDPIGQCSQVACSP